MNTTPRSCSHRLLPGALAALALAASDPAAHAQIVMDNTPVTTCDGYFTDSGGRAGDYGAGESFVKTITPGGSGTKLRADFTYFDVEGGAGCPADALTIHDGPSTAEPVIGVYCNASGSPGVVESTHPTGALTFAFRSDGSSERGGWVARLACAGGLHLMDAEPVTITSGTFTDSGGPGGSYPYPYGPNNYGPGENLVKTFHAASPGDALVVEFETFFVEALMDSLAIYDGDSTSDRLIGFWNNPFDTGPRVEVGRSGSLTFEFLSDNLIQYDGWQAQVYAVPASLLPVNDDCVDALPVGTGLTTGISLLYATRDGFSSCDCGLYAGRESVWYTFTAPFDGRLTVEMTSSGPGYVGDMVSLHQPGICPGDFTTQYDCDNQGPSPTVSRVMTPDESVLIRVAAFCSFFDAAGQIAMDVEFEVEGEDCSASIPIFEGTVTGNTVGAQPDGVASCGDPAGDGGDVWYRFTPQFDGRLTVDTFGTNDGPGLDLGIDTVLRVVDGCGSVELACDNDNASGLLGTDAGTLRDSAVSVRVDALNTVYVVVSSFGASLDGPYTLNVDYTPDLAFDDFCSGDGGDGLGCTACPCANDAAPGTAGGCRNSLGGSSALEARGVSEPANDTLRFEVRGALPSSFGLLVSADDRLPNAGPCPPGSGIATSALDGLRCVGGALLRHGTRATDAGGDIGVTNAGWGPPDGPAGGLAANGGFVAGQTRHFQVFYREEALLGCGTGQNTTNAISVTWR